MKTHLLTVLLTTSSLLAQDAPSPAPPPPQAVPEKPVEKPNEATKPQPDAAPPRVAPPAGTIDRRRVRMINSPGTFGSAGEVQPGAPQRAIPPMPAGVMMENCELTLTFREKDKIPVEVSTLTAGGSFNLQGSSLQLSLNGTVLELGDSSYLLSYSLNWSTPQAIYNTAGQVRLRSGKEQMLWKADGQTVKVKLKVVEEESPSEK